MLALPGYALPRPAGGAPRAVIGFRNLLGRGYDVVAHARVWRIIQAELPPLMGKVEEFLPGAGSR